MSDDILRSPRLVLEPLVPAHAEALFASFADPRLYPYMPTDPPASIDALRDRYRRLATHASPDGRERWLNWAARLAAAPIYIGLFKATVLPDATASLAYFVFSEHAHRGYGVEGAGVGVDHLFRIGPRAGRPRKYRHPEPGLDPAGRAPRFCQGKPCFAG